VPSFRSVPPKAPTKGEWKIRAILCVPFLAAKGAWGNTGFERMKRQKDKIKKKSVLSASSAFRKKNNSLKFQSVLILFLSLLFIFLKDKE
jgi:hypothetical protein